MQHVACNIVGSCCNMLSRVGQTNATLCNMVAKRTQDVACNNVARCCTNMLHPFGQGFSYVLTFNKRQDEQWISNSSFGTITADSKSRRPHGRKPFGPPQSTDLVEETLRRFLQMQATWPVFIFFQFVFRHPTGRERRSVSRTHAQFRLLARHFFLSNSFSTSWCLIGFQETGCLQSTAVSAPTSCTPSPTRKRTDGPALYKRSGSHAHRVSGHGKTGASYNSPVPHPPRLFLTRSSSPRALQSKPSGEPVARLRSDSSAHRRDNDYCAFAPKMFGNFM